MSWLLAITVLVSGDVFYYQEFPMANKEECESEIEWPGNSVHLVMGMGDEFKAECIPNLKKGEYVL